MHTLRARRANVLSRVIDHDYFAWMNSGLLDDVSEKAQVRLPHALNP